MVEEKGQIVKCPICKKEVELSNDSKGWDKLPESIKNKADEITGHVNWLIEFLNHDPDINTNSKRMMMLTQIINKIVGCTLVNNYNRLGMYNSLIYRINRVAEQKEIVSLLQTFNKSEKKKIEKKTGEYIS